MPRFISHVIALAGICCVRSLTHILDATNKLFQAGGEMVEGEEVVEEEEDTGPLIKRFSLQSKHITDPAPVIPTRSITNSLAACRECDRMFLRLFFISVPS